MVKSMEEKEKKKLVAQPSEGLADESLEEAAGGHKPYGAWEFSHGQKQGGGVIGYSSSIDLTQFPKPFLEME